VELNRRIPEFDALGATVVAVSADSPERGSEFALEEMILFPLASDPAGSTIRGWGLSEAGEARSVPATFVVDDDGIVRYRQVGDTIGDRSEVDELLAALRTR
jgi:peroxiredoxin Q/BCP